ncbi:VCBS repeat-containing protein, partial [Flavobacterium croceum DSM 17960]
GEVTFNPANNFNGTATLTYELCDAGTPVLCDTATITFTVDPVNDAPVLTNDTATTLEDTPVSGDITGTGDTDPDGTPLTVTTTPVSGPSHGTIVINPDGTYTYTPAPNWCGTDVVEIQVCDAGTPGVACTIQTLTITVTCVNDAPVANDDTVSLPLTEDGADGVVSILTNDTDADGNPTISSGHTVDLDPSTPGVQTTVTNAQGVWTYNPTTGEVTFNPANNFNGTATLTYELCDAGTPVLCDTAVITFTVTAVNDAPVLTNDTATTLEDNPVSGDITGAGDTDPDGTPLTVTTTPVSGPSHGTIVINPDGTYTYTPAPNWCGTDVVEIQVCDAGTPGVACTTETLTITVTCVNDAPVSVNDVVTAPLTEDEANGVVNILANDTDPDGNPTPTSGHTVDLDPS